MELTFKLLITVAVASLASLQFGYHLAELNAPQAVIMCEGLDPTISDCIPMAPQDIGLVNGMNAIGGMLGALFSGKLADRWGRRRVSLLNCVFFVAGSLTMVGSHTVAKMCSGRFLAGIGSGSGIVVTPMYLGEISPVQIRGIVGTANQVFVNLGILTAQLLGVFYSNEFEWRTILWAGACFGTLNAALLPFCCESPKWQAFSGQMNEARDTLQALRRDGASLEEEIATWRASSNNAEESQGLLGVSEATVKVGYKQFLTDPAFRPTLLAVVGVMSIQQLSGINSVIFYGVSILSSTLPQQARLINCFITFLNLLTTISVAPFSDKYGRRPLLLFSITGMGIFSAILSSSLLLGWSVPAAIAAMVFAMSFACGLGPIPFLIVSELTVSQAAGVSQSVATTANWVTTFLIGYLFPILQSGLGNSVFFIFTATGVCSFLYIRRFVPETKGKASAQQVWQQF